MTTKKERPNLEALHWPFSNWTGSWAAVSGCDYQLWELTAFQHCCKATASQGAALTSAHMFCPTFSALFSGIRVKAILLCRWSLCLLDDPNATQCWQTSTLLEVLSTGSEPLTAQGLLFCSWTWTLTSVWEHPLQGLKKFHNTAEFHS